MKISRLTALALIATLTATGVPASARALSSIEAEELQQSYQIASSAFYKQVEPQMLLDGSHTRLVTYLQKHGVPAPNVPAVHATGDVGRNVRELEREVDAVVGSYGTKFGSRTLTYEAIAGMIGALNDKYTAFLTPKEYASLNEGLDGGGFSGVGITIRVDEQTKILTALEVIADAPAAKAGVASGDVILEIDGKSTKGLTSEEDSKLLRGKEGTVVRLTIQRAGAILPEPISITRALIHIPTVTSRLLAGGIGYTRLFVFGSDTAKELTDALSKLEAQGAKAYVLDLRDNGGGYLEAAIDVSSKFVATGPIVAVEQRGGEKFTRAADNVAIAPKPLAVLVNKNTASASEITSAAIQDNGVGRLIGERTYGKGVVQTIYPMRDGSAVKITSARYLTPGGRDINAVGIEPDIIASEAKNARFGDPASDTQLQAALAYLQKQIARLGT